MTIIKIANNYINGSFCIFVNDNKIPPWLTANASLMFNLHYAYIWKSMGVFLMIFFSFNVCSTCFRRALTPNIVNIDQFIVLSFFLLVRNMLCSSIATYQDFYYFCLWIRSSTEHCLPSLSIFRLVALCCPLVTMQLNISLRLAFLIFGNATVRSMKSVGFCLIFIRGGSSTWQQRKVE